MGAKPDISRRLPKWGRMAIVGNDAIEEAPVDEYDEADSPAETVYGGLYQEMEDVMEAYNENRFLRGGLEGSGLLEDVGEMAAYEMAARNADLSAEAREEARELGEDVLNDIERVERLLR